MSRAPSLNRNPADPDAPALQVQPAQRRSAERTATVFWPAENGQPAVRCQLSIRRLEDGTPIVEVYAASGRVVARLDPELQQAAVRQLTVPPAAAVVQDALPDFWETWADVKGTKP